MDDFKGKRITIAGLGHFGGNIAAAQWLVQQGAKVLVTDKAPADKLADSIKQLDGIPIKYHLGEHREKDFIDTDLVIASPAIPPTNPYLMASRKAGIPISTEICLFVQRCPGKILAVSGTKGKSTTTALIGEILKKSTLRTWIGGNIGKSLLFDLPAMLPADVIVLELSSFMLDYLGQWKWSPHIAVLTMLASDHLEWHGSQQAYLAAKQELIRYQKPTDFAVLGEDCDIARQMAKSAKAKVLWYGLNHCKPFQLTLLPGRHNQLNAQAAATAVGALGIAWDQVQSAIRDFPGLPHRLQLVHESAGVRYYNDSIATIPDAAVAAASSFPAGKVIQILGGYDKGLPFDAMAKALRPHLKSAVCIGAAGPKIAGLLHAAPGDAQIHQCPDLAAAMQKARQLADPGDVILSTACASYDQYSNFEQRGDAFVHLARG